MSAAFLIELEENEHGWVAECPSLPSCVSEGATRDEAVENIRDAIRTYLETVSEVRGDQLRLVNVEFSIPGLSAA